MFIVFVWGNIACIDEFASVCSARAKKKMGPQAKI